MKKALLVLASIASVAFVGCASSSSGNPWATPDSKPLPAVQTSAPAAATTATPSDALFADDAELAASVAPASAVVAPAAEEEDLLSAFPAIRQANLEKALSALKAASAVEELPMPDKGNARVTRYNDQVGVIEFITPNAFSVGDHVVLTKENKAALVTVLAIEGNRVVADLVAGVKGSPVLKPADHVLCDIYRTPEELEKIAAEQRKAQREAILAARAAAQEERAAAAEEAAAAAPDEEEEVVDEEEESEEDEW